MWRNRAGDCRLRARRMFGFDCARVHRRDAGHAGRGLARIARSFPPQHRRSEISDHLGDSGFRHFCGVSKPAHEASKSVKIDGEKSELRRAYQDMFIIEIQTFCRRLTWNEPALTPVLTFRPRDTA